MVIGSCSGCSSSSGFSYFGENFGFPILIASVIDGRWISLFNVFQIRHYWLFWQLGMLVFRKPVYFIISLGSRLLKILVRSGRLWEHFGVLPVKISTGDYALLQDKTDLKRWSDPNTYPQIKPVYSPKFKTVYSSKIEPIYATEIEPLFATEIESSEPGLSWTDYPD